MNNRIWNCRNGYQGTYPRVLCVCSAGLLRSPTLAWVLSQDPWNFNTRACGIDEGHALIPLDDVLLTWADLILCMDEDQAERIESRIKKAVQKGLTVAPKVIALNIPDNFAYRDPKLVQIIKQKAKALIVEVEETPDGDHGNHRAVAVNDDTQGN